MAKIDATERQQLMQGAKAAQATEQKERDSLHHGLRPPSGGATMASAASKKALGKASSTVWESPFKRRTMPRPRSAVALPRELPSVGM